MIFSFVSCSQNEDKTAKHFLEEEQTTISNKSNEKAEYSKDKKGSEVIDGDFVHMVFFWLKEPDNKKFREEFTSSLTDFLKSSNDIKSYHLGTPANTYRPIIDTSYTYCMIVTFPSREEHDRYQNDPVHKEFLKNFKHSWEKVLIYDSENIN